MEQYLEDQAFKQKMLDLGYPTKTFEILDSNGEKRQESCVPSDGEEYRNWQETLMNSQSSKRVKLSE
jgi:hypothetical protein